MNNQELFENFHSIVIQHLANNNIQDISGFALIDNGDQKIKVSKWEYEIPQPTHDDLKKISIPAVNSAKENQHLSASLGKVVCLSAIQIAKTTPQEGAMCFNTDDGKLQVYTASGWV